LQNVFEPVVLSIIKVLIFIVVFILFFLATGIIIKLMRKSSKRRENSRKARNKHTSLIVKIDRILGGLFGICKSFVIILAITSILMYILSLTGTVLETNNFLTEVQNSVLLKYINEINPFNAVTEGLI
jgi:hypothetical protein